MDGGKTCRRIRPRIMLIHSQYFIDKIYLLAMKKIDPYVGIRVIYNSSYK